MEADGRVGRVGCFHTPVAEVGHHARHHGRCVARRTAQANLAQLAPKRLRERAGARVREAIARLQPQPATTYGGYALERLAIETHLEHRAAAEFHGPRTAAELEGRSGNGHSSGRGMQ